ncbi:hypothetical protein [Methylobacterium sp. A54F]
MTAPWISAENLNWLLATLCLLVPALVFIAIRGTVKVHRQGIVRDLATVFQVSKKGEATDGDGPIPSFEFVKYKYFLGRPRDGQERNQEDFSAIDWASGLLPLVVVLILAGYLVSRSFEADLLNYLLGTACASADDICAWQQVRSALFVSLLAAFAGGYIFMIRSFFRAINNFDLGPGSFVGAAINLIAGGALMTILVFGFDIVTHATRSGGWFGGLLLALGYAVGQLPESASRMVTDRSRLAHVKRYNPRIYREISATPVDIVDGIDSEIRDRLADHHIRSTQNLATANPLMLFVETPYGVYQIMDWVAQAQLCCSVGPDKLLLLWRLGIRTLFDLERAALDDRCRSPELLRAIGAILFADEVRADEAGATTKHARDIHPDMVVASIQVKLDDPHVHRLRQLFILVGERLGKANRRFSASPPGETPGERAEGPRGEASDEPADQAAAAEAK